MPVRGARINLPEIAMDALVRLVPGQVVGAYQVDSLVGEGANAQVYLVHHRTLRSRHALKVLHKVATRKRLRVEQEAVFRDDLRHPNIVPAVEAIDVGGRPGLVMDHVDGPSLARWFRETDAGLAERLEVLRAVLDGVRYAHGRGVVHRDLKPSNVLLDTGPGKRWIPRISDFGIAKALSPEIGRFGGLTTVNTGLGTVGYAAPEQVRDASRVDHRADLYAFGCLLYEAACGVAPFAGLSTMDTLQSQQQGRFRAPQELAPDAPSSLHALLRELLSPRPEDRPGSADDVARRLDQSLAELRTRSPAPATTRQAAPAPASEGTDAFPYVAGLVTVPALALVIGAIVVLGAS
jgi:serine/threonine-protein kinase